MNETVVYQWSEELARASIRAFYRARVGRLSVLTVASIVLLPTGAWAYLAMEHRIGLYAVLFGVFFLLINLTIRVGIRRMARDAARLRDDPTVSVTIADDSMSISSQNASRTVQWSRLTKVKESEGFLLLFAGTLLLASLPLASLSEQQRLFIRKKAGNPKY
jgi:hypothetical protein